MRKLWRLGFQASLDEVLSVGAALQFGLAERNGRGTAFVVGSQALVDHVADAGLRVVNNTAFATRADVVVVGGHDDLVFEELKLATQAVLRGAELIGATRDANFPMPDGPWPGTGAVLAAIEVASGRKADHVVGKPEPAMYDAALRPPRRRAARSRVGDRLDVDVAGARRAGLDSALVLTGGTTRAEARPTPADPSPTPDARRRTSLGRRSVTGRPSSLPAAMDGPVCLIVNPHAGGGRALRLLPGVEAALRGAGTAVPGRSRRCRCSTPASWPARRATRRDRRRDGRRRDRRRGRGRAARRQGPARRPARRARQRLRAQARDPVRPRRGRDAAADRRRDAGSTSPRPTGRRYLGILSAGLRLRRQPDRARDAPEARHVRLHLRRAARDRVAGARPPWELTIDGEPRAFAGYSVAVCNSGVFGGGMYLAPDARARRRPARRRADLRAVQAALPARPAARVQRHAPAGPGGHARAGPRDHVRAPTARSPPTPTATRSPSCRVTVRALPGALRVVAPR